MVHPREVLKLVIVFNSGSIIVAHNHLSFYR
ncbi:JAB domain-containing protein [Bacillus wiedmannii]|nr:JAB domain-containing protein [Bacillus wiedmannii]